MTASSQTIADVGVRGYGMFEPAGLRYPPEPVDNENPPDRDRPDISIVLPFRNEQDSIPELIDRLRSTLEAERLSYELVFVDDGSTDGGVSMLEEQARRDDRIKVIVLSRNFGQQIAAAAGIDTARGEMVVWMDSDLQERPEDIPRLVAKYREGFDVVYATRTGRRQAWPRSMISLAFVRVLNRVVGLGSCSNRATFRLFSREMAESLRRIPERNRYMAYLMPWMGYRSAEIEIELDERRRGRTNYSWAGLVKLGLTGLTSFSLAPLRISAICSCLAFLGCVVGVLWVLYGYFTHGCGVSGWASLIIALLVLHGLQFAVLAILGEYVGLSYTEAKRRPLYFCTRRINLGRRAKPTAGSHLR